MMIQQVNPTMEKPVVPFKDTRWKFNHFLKRADADNESETVALIDELFAEDYVLHTGGSNLSDPKDVKGREGLREHCELRTERSAMTTGLPLVCGLGPPTAIETGHINVTDVRGLELARRL